MSLWAAEAEASHTNQLRLGVIAGKWQIRAQHMPPNHGV